MLLSLYLHFPFCKRKCSYCDFCSAAATPEEIAAYCHALEAEIALAAKVYGRLPVDTVFLGGGTPSIVPAALMRGVLSALRQNFSILQDAEFTSEANPGTLTDAWMDALAEAGMNRLSIGVQAIQEPLLRTLGRIHDFPQTLEALRMARAHGIANLNADAMFGLPGQTLADYLDTLRTLANTGVTHISAYSLILEEGTPLYRQVERRERAVPDEDATADMLERGVRLLNTLGYQRYEISNFAKPGYVCKHNLGYWRQKRYLGLGVSAASLLPAPDGEPRACYLRQSNTTSVRKYIRMLSEGKLPVAASTPVYAEEAMFEMIMLGLRTVEGIRYADFERMHNRALTEVYGDAIHTLEKAGLLQAVSQVEPRLALNERGLLLQNTALLAFMKDA